MSARDEGGLRDAYLALMTGARARLDGTQALQWLDDAARQRPRSVVAQLRTMLAVHNVDDLVRQDLPWWTYRAIDVVQGYLAGRAGNARVFEYGSGASTVWLARRARSVVAVEHDGDWAERVEQLLGAEDLANVRIVVPDVPRTSSPEVGSAAPTGRGLEFRHYVETLDREDGDFDLVAVDGRARSTCVRAATRRVGEDGLVLLDDAQRPRYQPVIEELAASGWRVLRARGAAPCDPLPRETVLFAHGSAADAF